MKFKDLTGILAIGGFTQIESGVASYPGRYLCSLMLYSTLLFFSWSCKKTDIACPDSAVFCSFVEVEDYDATGPLIDEFLSSLRKNDSDENLKHLAEWLECMSCVKKARILCNSCIETLPPQSELEVVFVSNGQTSVKIMDVAMDQPIRFAGYH